MQQAGKTRGRWAGSRTKVMAGVALVLLPVILVAILSRVSATSTPPAAARWRPSTSAARGRSTP